MVPDSNYAKKYETDAFGYSPEKSGLIEKFFSSRLLENNKLYNFIKRLEPMMLATIAAAKKLQFYTNYTVDKNEKNINI